MDFKLALLDLDGTLLNKTGNIPDKHLEVLKKYTDNGGKIVICTGRWPVSAKFFNSKVQEYTGVKNDYMISLNGAIISDSNTNKVYFSKYINEDVFKKLLLVREKFKVAMWIYSKSGIESKIIHTYQIPFKKIISKFNYGKVVSHDSYVNNAQALKVLFIHWDKKRIEKAFEWLNKYFSNYLTISKTSSNNLEITAYKTSKGEALEKISELMNIPKNEIAVFGDSGNDISMFEKAGLKISIGEKNQDLLDVANNFVSKKEGGFATAIEKYLLNDSEKLNHKNVSYTLKFNKLNSNLLLKDFVKNKNVWNYLIHQNQVNYITNNPLWMNLNYFNNFLLNKNTYISSGNFNSLFSLKKNNFISSRSFYEKDRQEIINTIKSLLYLDNIVIVLEYEKLLPTLYYKNYNCLSLISKDLKLDIKESMGLISELNEEELFKSLKKLPLNFSIWSSDKKIQKYCDVFTKKFKTYLNGNCLTFYPTENIKNDIEKALYNNVAVDHLYSFENENDNLIKTSMNKLDEILSKDFNESEKR